MTTQVDATLINGVPMPDRSLPLPDQTRVRLTVEPLADQAAASQAAWQSIQARLQVRPLHFGGERFTRDELHERR